MAGSTHEEETEMTFLEHLEELRWHIIRAAVAVVVIAIACFIFSEFIFDHIILAPKNADFITNHLLCKLGGIIGSSALCINTKGFQLINIRMAGQFSSDISISLITGIIFSFPYVFWEMWRFISPALHDEERRYTRMVVFTSSLLFFLGVLFGYYVITPLSVHFLGSYQVSSQVVNQINLGSYVQIVTSIVLAGGVIFELPILIYFLSKIGLVTPEFLRTYRRHAVVIILFLSAIITPPDIFSQLLVSLPLFLLYETGIFISRRIQKYQLAE